MPRDPITGVYTRVSNTFSDPVLGEIISPTDADDFWDDLTDALNNIPPAIIEGPFFFVACVADGTTDVSALIQAKIDEADAAVGGTVIVPSGVMVVNDLSIPSSIHLTGSPPQVFKGDADQGLPGTIGSYFKQTATGTPCITVENESNGAIISNIGFLQTQPADAPGWVPTVYAACILNLSAGTRFENLVFWGCYDGIQFGRLTPSVLGSGQCSAIGIRAACYRYGINVVVAGDWITVDDYEFQAFMLGNLTNQLAYMQANAVAYHSEDNVAPVIGSIKTFGIKGGILCESNAQGSTGLMQVDSMWIDSAVFALWVQNATSIIQVGKINVTGDNLVGSFCVEVDDVSYVQISELRSLLSGGGSVYALGGGDVAIGDAFVNRCNQDNTGASCFITDASSRITVSGRLLRGFGAFPMTIHNGTGTFVQKSVSSTGTGDFEAIFKNSENLTANRTATVVTGDANVTFSMLQNTETLTGVKTFGTAGAVGRLKIAGTTSGAVTIDAPAVAGSGTIVTPVTGTLATLAGAETLTNKTLTTPIIATVNNTGGVANQGTNTNDSAAAGYIGEAVTSANAGVSLVTDTPKTIASVSLTAGDWDVWCQIEFFPAAGTTVDYQLASISETNNARDGTVGYSTIIPLGGMVVATFVGSGAIQSGPVIKKLASTTTIYGVAQSKFAVSTQTASALMIARRRR